MVCHLVIRKVGEDQLIRIREKEVLVQLPLEVVAVCVSLSSAPGAIQESPGPGNEDRVPSVVDALSRNEHVAWKSRPLNLNWPLRELILAR